MIVHKVIRKRFPLVSQAQNESPHAECRVGLHDMPENRLFADRNHGFREQFRHFPQTGPFASAQNDDGGNLFLFPLHLRLLLIVFLFSSNINNPEQVSN